MPEETFEQVESVSSMRTSSAITAARSSISLYRKQKFSAFDLELLPADVHKEQDWSKYRSLWDSIGKKVDEDQVANAMLTESFADYDSGQYSPRYLSQSQLEPGTLVTTEEDDAKRLVFARLQVQGTGKSVQPATSLEEEVLQREARKGMTNDEAEFSVESILDSQVYLWSDKYRPRKPRYFNRYKTNLNNIVLVSK
ncbi:hypothetical protein J6590_084487 [Homalodisca vitripennis]|nr:hypothetical protein J6590_084487 [Homalodisca vitripennis]